MAPVGTTSSAPILIVETDEMLGNQIANDLQGAGYTTVTVREAAAALQHLSQSPVSLVLADRMLAGQSGLWMCRQLREQGHTVAVLLMMARDELEDRIACLEAGADDYLLKPYRPDTFLRFISVYLRPSESSKPHLRFADLTLDLGQRLAVREQQPISLTMKEFELLKYLMEHPGEVLSREQILENVWGYNFMGESNVIEVYVRYLRLKLEDGDRKRIIQTVRGIGYVLREP
ncbi:MAG: response regulator transcription factor [Cyanobacteria bacterium P01_C01_bin.89]